MLTSDTRFLLKNLLSKEELTHTVSSLRADPLIKCRTYTTPKGKELFILNASKGLHSPRNHYHMVAKGLVVSQNPDGTYNLESLPFTKFYNSFEDVAVNDLKSLSGSTIMYAMKKQDGTLIQRFVFDGDVYFTTRSMIINLPNESFEEYESSPAFFYDLVKKVETDKSMSFLHNPNIAVDKTLIFELVGPSNIILEAYTEDELVLIGSLDKANLSYEPIDAVEIDCLKTQMYTGVESLADLTSLGNDGKVVEGYVLEYWANSAHGPEIALRVKVKTEEYLELLKLKSGVSDSVIWDNYLTGLYEDFEAFTFWFDSKLTETQRVYREELLNRYRDIWGERHPVADFRRLHIALGLELRYGRYEGNYAQLPAQEQYEYAREVAEFSGFKAFAGPIVNYIRKRDGSAFRKSLFDAYRKSFG